MASTAPLTLWLVVLCAAFALGGAQETDDTFEWQCVMDITCSGWPQPCNWAYTSVNEILAINNVRRNKTKCIIFRLPNQNYKNCMEINRLRFKHTNCCDYFCFCNKKQTCF